MLAKPTILQLLIQASYQTGFGIKEQAVVSQAGCDLVISGRSLHFDIL